jgi:membrane protease YdiL (CAAX protease family)
MIPSSHDPAVPPVDPPLPLAGGAADAPPGTAAPALAPAAEAPREGLTRRKRISIELAVVMLVVWVPILFSGLSRDEGFPSGGTEYLIGAVLYGAGVFTLLSYLAWLDGDARAFLGLRRPRPADLGWSVVALVAITVVPRVATTLVLLVVPSGEPATSTDGSWDSAALPAWFSPSYAFVWAWGEEALYRAYLWNRLTELSRRPVLSIVACSALFAISHGYPLAGTLHVFFGGLVLGWMYSARRSLWPLVLAHWTYNLLVT